jgi:hypothetical protein
LDVSEISLIFLKIFESLWCYGSVGFCDMARITSDLTIYLNYISKFLLPFYVLLLFEFAGITCIHINEESKDTLGEKQVIFLVVLRTKLVSVPNFSSKQNIEMQK